MAARTRQDESAAKPKNRYQVKNWAEYDRALVNRGNLTIWLDETSIADSWTPPKPVGRGKPGLYSDVAIQTCLTLKTLFRLPYRATEGLLKALMRLLAQEPCPFNAPVNFNVFSAAPDSRGVAKPIAESGVAMTDTVTQVLARRPRFRPHGRRWLALEH